MPAAKDVPLADLLVAFHEDSTLREISRRLGVSRVRLRTLWKRHFGEEAFNRRVSQKISPEAELAAYAAFVTHESFKSVAARLGTSPNTLRVLWIAKFGSDAFAARSKLSHSRAGERAGRAGAGKKKNISMTEVVCSSCGAPLFLNRLQRARTVKVLCNACKNSARKVDRYCPVCGFGCLGPVGLAHHLTRPKKGDRQAHLAYFHSERARLDQLRWEGLEEGQDYVVCRVCGLKGVTLTNHIKLHDLTAGSYAEKFPGSLLTPPVVETRRLHALQGYYDDLAYGWSQEDLLKFTDEKGRVIVAEAAMELHASPSTVLQYCQRLNLPTRNRLAWQRTVLDSAAKALKASYKWEWSDPRIINSSTGRRLNYDGFFPKLNLIVEAHGDQHFRFSETWHGTLDLFHRLRERDAFKKRRAEELGYKVLVVRPSDPTHDPNFWQDRLGGQPAAINIEPIFASLREGPFPTIQPMDTELRKALTRIRRLDAYVDEQRLLRPYSTVGTTACGSFFPQRYHAKHKGSLSAWEAWHSDDALRKAIQLQVDSGHPTTPLRVLRALVMHHRTPSVFRPMVAKYICKTFAHDGVMWDPCAGYGGRLLGALAAGLSLYIGTDVEASTIEGNNALANALGLRSMVRLVLSRAEVFDPGCPLDLVFTSPPYFDTESYGEDSMMMVHSYGSAIGWAHGFLRPVIARAAERLKPGGHLVLNLPHKPIQSVRLDLEAVSLAREFGFTSLPTLWMPVRTFRGTLKGEPILIWRR